jgi:ribonuclease-3 family protein
LNGRWSLTLLGKILIRIGIGDIMQDFAPQMTLIEVNQLSMLALAHVGDGVYELLFRSRLAMEGHKNVANLHKLTVSKVNAVAQAKAAEKIMPLLSADELALYKRGRNAKVNSVPHNANLGQYHAATGLESLFGWLYLQGKTERVKELFEYIAEEDNAT